MKDKLARFVEENDLSKSSPLLALFYYSCEVKIGRIRRWLYLKELEKICSGEEHEFWVLFFYRNKLTRIERGLRNLDEDWEISQEIDDSLEELVNKFGEDWKVIGVLS